VSHRKLIIFSKISFATWAAADYKKEENSQENAAF
jgi:hypothetical protein